MTRLLSRIGYAVLIFGFMYVAWHMGRAFESGKLDAAALIPGHEYRALINEKGND